MVLLSSGGNPKCRVCVGNSVDSYVYMYCSQRCVLNGIGLIIVVRDVSSTGLELNLLVELVVGIETCISSVFLG